MTIEMTLYLMFFMYYKGISQGDTVTRHPVTPENQS